MGKGQRKWRSEGLIVVKIKSASVEYTGKVDICSSSNCMEIWLDL